MATPHAGDIGTEIRLDFKEDLTAALVIKIVLLRPTASNRTMIKDPTDVSGTVATYVTVEGDLSAPGKYQVQAYYEDATWKGYTTVATFTVEKHIVDVAATL